MAKLRSLQLIRMVLRISECQHLEGIRCGGKYETLFSAPRQPETISTLPFNVGWILFILRSNRWIAMSPRSSPWYVFAMSRHSENDSTIQPRPFAHSRTKAAEHKLEYNLLIYEPSVTATRELSLMERWIHSVPPGTVMFSHSHVLPHNLRTSRKVVGVWAPASR